LNGIVTSDKAEIAAKFDGEIFEPFDQPAMKIRFRMLFGQIQEFNEIAIPKD